MKDKTDLVTYQNGEVKSLPYRNSIRMVLTSYYLIETAKGWFYQQRNVRMGR